MERSCQTVGLREEDAELLDSRTLGKLSSYIDLPTRLGQTVSGRDRLYPFYIHSAVGAKWRDLNWESLNGLVLSDRSMKSRAAGVDRGILMLQLTAGMITSKKLGPDWLVMIEIEFLGA
jgi:hypothetical protein